MAALTNWSKPVLPCLGGRDTSPRPLGAAINMQCLPGQISRHIRSQKYRRTGDFVDVAGTPQWHAVADPTQRCLTAELRQPFGERDIGRYRVDADPVRGQF